jgi:hypothetical protein
MDDEPDAILIGGPRDGTVFHARDIALVELELDGMLHRYIRTTQERDHDGGSLLVYNYDGEVNPSGAQPGIETDLPRHDRR